jgi:hypothetical protein
LQSRGIEDFSYLGQLEKPPNRVRFKGDLGQSYQPKMHKVLIRDTQQNPQEIVRKTPPRKSQQTALTKKGGKSTTQP